MPTFDFTQGTMPANATLSRPAGSWSRVSPDKQIVKGTAADVPRFDYNPLTGAPRGILYEAAATNGYRRTERVGDNTVDGTLGLAVWSQNANTFSFNFGTAPDGSNNAAYMMPTTANNVHNIAGTGPCTSRTVAVGDKVTKSIFVQRVDYQLWRLSYPAAFYANGRQAIFDCGNGQVVTIDGATVTSVEAFPNNWFRLAITGTATSAGTAGYGALGINQSTASDTFAGSGTEGTNIWGAQVELGAKPSSYIPAPDFTEATRPAETLTLNWTARGVAADQTIPIRYVFDDDTYQDVSTTISRDGNVVPLTLNRSRIKQATTDTAAVTTGSAAGSATLTGQGSARANSTGTATGATGASGSGRSTVIATGTSAGASTLVGAGVTIVTATGSAAGAATAAGSGSARSIATGTAAGGTTAFAQSASQVLVTTRGMAVGSSLVAADGRSIARADGTISGGSTAISAGTALIVTVGAATGGDIIAGTGAATARADGQASGAAILQGVSPNRPSFFPPDERSRTLVDIAARAAILLDIAPRRVALVDQAARSVVF